MAEISDDTYIRCPQCWHEEWVSPEDPDASLSMMWRHMRWSHVDQDANKLLAKVVEVKR